MPWYAALSGLVLYLATTGAGVELNNLTLTARLAGWDETPMVGQPLLWVLTLPIRWLPAACVPVAVKALAALLAAAVLGILARTVQLLPWDRPWDGVAKWAAVLPAAAAGLFCGLEFSFWQEATSDCGELLDLALLATAGWLMLEYSRRRQSVWLEAATIVWGAGMAQNWVMLLSTPLFIAGLIGLLGLRFFQVKAMLRLAALGLAGFAVYAVLPLVNGLSPHSAWGLGQSWLASLRQTRMEALVVFYQFWRGHRLLTLAVTIYFLVPTLPLLVRLRDTGSGNTFGVDRFQLWLYRALRLALLLACCWLAFDPRIAARQMVYQQMGVWLPLLTLDYLIALGAAFLLGNLILTSLPDAGRENHRRARSAISWKAFVAPAAAGLVAVMAAGLAGRNGPAILHLNFQSLDEFGAAAVDSLPPGGGVLLSDDPRKLAVFEAGLARRHQTSRWLAVDTHRLPMAAYRADLERRRPGGWLTGKSRHELSPLESLRLLEHVAESNRLFYLHSSYGYFFEGFYLAPAGLVFEMKLRGRDPLDLPRLPGGLMEANEQVWTGLWESQLAGLVPPPAHRLNYIQEKLKGLGLERPPRMQDRVLEEWYSMGLDAWAVALQREGRLAQARARFEQALALNTNNVSARVSLGCNTNLQGGVRMGVDEVGKVAAALHGPERLNAIMNVDGPFDDPTLSFLLGTSFIDQGLLLQAAEQCERVREMTPGALIPELTLAEIYNQLQMSARSRPLIDHARQEAARLPANNLRDMNLALLDSYAWLLQTNTANARHVLASLVEQYPNDPQINNRVLAWYVSVGDWTNALKLADARLARDPGDAPAMNNKAMILLQGNRPGEAIGLLDRALALTNLPTARLNRGFARLSQDDFARAEADFLELERESNSAPMVEFGLAVVAEHGHDTNRAAGYLRRCLTNSPAGSPLWLRAQSRLKALGPAAATK